MHIAVDVKNMALHAGGIAAYARPLVAAWLSHRPDFAFSLVAPEFDTTTYSPFHNWKHVKVGWPERLPRSLRHPVYDTIFFPRTIAALRPRPQFVFSFYHDVLLPAPSSGIASAMMIHDTCIEELADVYPRRIRLYYLALLRTNLNRVRHIVTVSQASRQRIIELYDVPPERVSVVYNAIGRTFGGDLARRAGLLRAQHGPSRLLLHAGGSEYRKNIGRLLDALEHLIRLGRDVRLLSTGVRDEGWQRALEARDRMTVERVCFLGRLSNQELEAAYAAADAVVYPTLCEGFGRVCLEAMTAGAPLACSDLPVLREVASDYAHYFDPTDTVSIAQGIERALASGCQPPRRDPRFEEDRVATEFVTLMEKVVRESHLQL